VRMALIAEVSFGISARTPSPWVKRLPWAQTPPVWVGLPIRVTGAPRQVARPWDAPGDSRGASAPLAHFPVEGERALPWKIISTHRSRDKLAGGLWHWPGYHSIRATSKTKALNEGAILPDNVANTMPTLDARSQRAVPFERANHPSFHINGDTLLKEAHFNDEPQLVPVQDSSFHARERPADQLDGLPFLEFLFRGEGGAAGHEGVNLGEVTLQICLFDNIDHIGDEVCFKSSQASSAVAVQKDVAGEERHVARENAAIVTPRLAILGEEVGNAALVQAASQRFLGARPSVQHPPAVVADGIGTVVEQVLR